MKKEIGCPYVPANSSKFFTMSIAQVKKLSAAMAMDVVGLII